MVHTHQPRGMRIHHDSCCGSDSITNDVFSIEPRGPPQEAPKRYEYRSFAEALKIPMLGSAFYAIRKLYWMVRSSCFLFFCVLTVWETVVVSIARIANAIFWFRLFLILVDSTIFRVIVCLRQRYPVLGTEYSELVLAVKNTFERCRKIVAANSRLVLSKLLAIGRFVGVSSLCNRLNTLLDKFESLVDWYFPIETGNRSGASSPLSSESNSADTAQEQVALVNGEPENLD